MQEQAKKVGIQNIKVKYSFQIKGSNGNQWTICVDDITPEDMKLKHKIE